MRRFKKFMSQELTVMLDIPVRQALHNRVHKAAMGPSNVLLYSPVFLTVEGEINSRVRGSIFTELGSPEAIDRKACAIVKTLI